MRIAILAGILILPVIDAHAAEIAVIEKPARIPIGQTQRFNFGTLPQKDTTVLLDIVSRLDSETFGGSMYFLKIELNGRLVAAAKTRTVNRLVNRPLVSPIAPNLPYAWFGAEAWRVLYAPDFQGALRYKYYVGNPYRISLDVTDLINPAAENRLEITNQASSSHARAAKRSADLVIDSLTVRTRLGASPTMQIVDGADEDVINHGTPGAGPAKYRGRVLSGGGFTVETGDRTFAFASVMSYPAAGWNRLRPAAEVDATGQKGWTVRVRTAADGGKVVSRGPDYELDRTIRFTPRRIDVADRITNLHPGDKLGLMVRHEVSLKGVVARVRLAGNPNPAVNRYYANANPSVYVALEDIGLGIICQDDVFRNQAWLFYDAERESAGLEDPYLCLQPGGEYTLRWSVYPVASADYFDFVNLVRQDWGSNYTLHGAWCFFNPDTILAMPTAFLQDNFRRLGIKYAVYCGGWVDRKHDQKKIGFGTGVMDPYWADFRRRLREAAQKIRATVPECKVLVYYDTQRDTSDGGHERFRDSWLTDARGRQLSTEWSGVYSLTWSVVATLENSFGKAMLKVADQYFDEIGVDGLYWDEMEATGYGVPLIAHTIPDGYSCLLNKETYTIEREIGITSILGKAHRAAVIDRVRAHGGIVMGNGPTTNRVLLAKQVQRMVEIQHNDYWCYQGNLDTPLGYASSRMDFGNWIRGLRMGTLLVGTRYTYDYDFSRYVFPFTPIELHAGYLLGKERIITIHDGNFGWPGERCLVQVHHFDRDGKRTGKAFATAITHEAKTKVEIPYGEAVVLERLPVTLTPRSGQAAVKEACYDRSGLSLSVRAPSGASLRIASGTFPIVPQQRLKAQIGDAWHSLTAQADVIVELPLPPTTAFVTVRLTKPD